MVDNSDEDVGLLADVLNSAGRDCCCGRVRRGRSVAGHGIPDSNRLYVCGGKLTRKFTYNYCATVYMWCVHGICKVHVMYLCVHVYMACVHNPDGVFITKRQCFFFKHKQTSSYNPTQSKLDLVIPMHHNQNIAN